MRSLRANGWVLSLALVGISLCSAAPAFANTYYIAANGSDSNTGTQSQPWAHAPGMPNCSATCKSVTPQPGDRFIFKGGDTWHWGITGDTSSVGGTWNWTWSGASGNPIYIGVDKTWYSGASWSRPIMSGDNSTSTSAVSSCTYDDSSLNLIYYGGQDSYVTMDNFEFTGFCWHGNQANANEHICCANIINWYCDQASCNNTLSNLYIHGWTHVTYGCSLNGGEPTGNCDGAVGIKGTTNGGQGGGDTITGTVCDGSDTDGVSLYCVYGDCYAVTDSFFQDNSNGAVCNNGHILHDDTFQDIHESTDGVMHGNAFEWNSEWGGVNYAYNIILRNNTTAVTGWLCPNGSDVYWNFLVYGNTQEPLNIGGNGCPDISSTPVYLYNSTFVNSGGIGAPGYTWDGKLTNDLMIDSTFAGTGFTETDNIYMTGAQATTAGITTGSTFPYQLTSSNCNGAAPCPVNTGANLTSSWPQGFLTDDTTLACTYITSNHTMNCPARTPVQRPSAKATTSTGQPAPWDVGAFELGTAISSAPIAPSNLTAVVN